MSQDDNHSDIFDDLGFDPFSEDGGETGLPEAGGDRQDVASQDEVMFGVSDIEAPLDRPEENPLAGLDLPEMPFGPVAVEEPEADETAAPLSAKEQKKAAKKKQSKAKKEKKPRKSGGAAGHREPLGLEGVLCLVLGGLLALGLILSNVYVILSDRSAFGIGLSSLITYIVFVDFVGLIGVVSVPFLFLAYRKTLDVFKVGLGLSAMAMSLGVMLLVTEFFRYDFMIKAPSGTPSPAISVDAPVELPPDEQSDYSP